MVRALVPLLAAALLVPGALVAAPAAAHAPCEVGWGSMPEAAEAAYARGTVVDVRAGRHECFDRLVVDIAGGDGTEAYDVRYVPAATALGSGFAVPVRGGAVLEVVVRAPAHEGYVPTYTPPHRDEVVDVDGFTTLRQVAWAGSFEAQTALGVGVRARLPFRAFTLPGVEGTDVGTRLVIDVAHTW